LKERGIEGEGGVTSHP